MIKLGVYMGPTGNLFAVIPRQELMGDIVDEGMGEYAITTVETDEEEAGFIGEGDEFAYLLEGFEYLGDL